MMSIQNFILVPVKPTPEMVEESRDYLPAYAQNCGPKVWDAMIGGAPVKKFTRAEVAEMLRGVILNDYGVTELLDGQAVSFNLDELARLINLMAGRVE